MGIARCHKRYLGRRYILLRTMGIFLLIRRGERGGSCTLLSSVERSLSVGVLINPFDITILFFEITNRLTKVKPPETKTKKCWTHRPTVPTVNAISKPFKYMLHTLKPQTNKNHLTNHSAQPL